MNKEEIKVMIKDGVYSEDGITYMSDKQYNNYINIIERLQQENQKLKKQLEEANTTLDTHNELIEYMKNQQKEFIEWLTNEANINPYEISDYTYEDIINTLLIQYYQNIMR